MIWLGRIDFRMLEPNSFGELTLDRRQLEAALALRTLMDDAARESHQRVDALVTAFVGEHDFMTAPQLDQLMSDLGITSVAELDGLSDETLAEAISAGGYGVQRISSHIMTGGLGGGTTPLPASFALFGQRYVIDAHVFSNLVYDRLNGGDTRRMMPNPLDVAYAALRNDQAAALLADELDAYQYHGDLEAMRLLVDEHPDAYWEANLYNLWLRALRTLSPDATAIADADAGLPAVARTELWGRRLINTQLASWAELRHDTILYAKQSYTGGATCEFPDAYVDPYPEFYAALSVFATRGANMVDTLGLPAENYTQQRLESFFVNLQNAAGMLQEMAEYQRAGTPFTETHMAFINEAVRIHWGCGDPAGAEGWYPKLFFSNESSVTFDPTIADVHTQPTDEAGNPVGRVLHVGTGMPRAMVVTVDTCTGSRAYVGLVSSYFERVTEDFDRLDDIRWSQELMQSGTPSDVKWMSPAVVR